MFVPNEIVNLIFTYVEKNRIGILFINPIIGWNTYLRHYYGEDEAFAFYHYYFSRYKTVYSKTTITFPLTK